MRNLSSLNIVAASLMLAAETGSGKGAAVSKVENPFDTAFTLTGFKRSKGKDVSYDENVTTTKRLADVILEIGKTGMVVSGVNIQRIKHLKDNGTNKAGKVELVMRWPNKGKQAGFAQVLVAESNEAQANLDAFATRIKGEFDTWYAKDAETRVKAVAAGQTGESFVPANEALYQ